MVSVHFGKVYKVVGAPSTEESHAFAERWTDERRKDGNASMRADYHDKFDYQHRERTDEEEARLNDDSLPLTLDDIVCTINDESPVTYIFTDEPDELTGKDDLLAQNAFELFTRVKDVPVEISASTMEQLEEKIKTWLPSMRALILPDMQKLESMQKNAEEVLYRPHQG